MDFAKLKRSNSLDSLKTVLQSSGQQKTSGKPSDDDRFWQPTVDKAGNGMAVIRFLPTPAVDGDSGVPWVQEFKHAFQGPGGWLIDTCPTTAGQQCPVCNYNTQLWNSGVESNKEVARKQKRKLTYITNVLVISDPSNPENEGQVKLFKFGKKIFDKIQEAIKPPFPDEEPFNPFCPWTGANLKLKMRNVEGYRNYDKSEFDSTSPIGDDDFIEEIWRKEYSLKEFVDPNNIPTFEKLEKRLNVVLGASVAAGASKSAAESTKSRVSDIDVDDDIPPELDKPTSRAKVSSGFDEDDEDFFKTLVEETED